MNSSTRIKICGVKNVGDIAAAHQAGASYVGLMFAEGSPRQLSLEDALSILSNAPDELCPVGVFQNQSHDMIARWPYPHIQLHGDEDEAFMATLKSQRPDAIILRGFRFDPDAIRRWDRCDDIDYLLIDGSSGGHGEAFDHAALIDIIRELKTPVFLAGGLNPTTIGDAIALVHPFGVDVSSGVESSRGVKSHELISAFGAAVRLADQLS